MKQIPPDLDSPDEIEHLVRIFYARVEKDDLLGPIFVEQASVDWREHALKLTAFWCQQELGIAGFHGSPTQKHSVLSKNKAFRAELFARFVGLFHDTVNSSWDGPHAESVKARALEIARAQSQVVVNAEPWDGTHPPAELP